MKIKAAMDTSYLPVQYVYLEVIQESIDLKRSGKVFFFDSDNRLEMSEGHVVAMDDAPDGVFIIMEPKARIRIDRIITLFGKPGAAYDEYSALGNTCMECSGGYDFD